MATIFYINKKLDWTIKELENCLYNNAYGFKVIEDEINIQDIKELHLEKDYQLSSSIDWEIQDKINELIKVIKQLDNKIKEKEC